MPKIQVKNYTQSKYSCPRSYLKINVNILYFESNVVHIYLQVKNNIQNKNSKSVVENEIITRSSPMKINILCARMSLYL